MKPISLLTAAALSLFVLHLAGCTGQSRMTSQGQTPAYADGFADGCQSGRVSGGSIHDSYKRNAGRFESDRQYAEGWSAGHRKCEDEQMQRSAAGSQ
jgi:hypothetical protein